MLPRRLRRLRGGVRVQAVGGTVRRAAGRAGSGTAAATSGVAGSGLFVALDDVIKRHVESAGHGFSDSDRDGNPRGQTVLRAEEREREDEVAKF